MSNRSALWHAIWAKKYQAYQDHENLHVAAGYDMLTHSQWQTLTGYFIDRLNLTSESRILEVGCGCGAFLNEVTSKVKSIAGVDYSEPAITKLKTVLEGDFQVSDASSLPYADSSFESVLSFGVFFYFEDIDYASQVLDEMRRVLSPGGQIFIGEVSDVSKKAIAEKIRKADTNKRDSRKVSNVDADHLYYDQAFFLKYADKYGMHCEIIEENVDNLKFYPNSSYRFSVILKYDPKD